jgi:hypothetical protein
MICTNFVLQKRAKDPVTNELSYNFEDQLFSFHIDLLHPPEVPLILGITWLHLQDNKELRSSRSKASKSTRNSNRKDNSVSRDVLVLVFQLGLRQHHASKPVSIPPPTGALMRNMHFHGVSAIGHHSFTCYLPFPKTWSTSGPRIKIGPTGQFPASLAVWFEPTSSVDRLCRGCPFTRFHSLS